MKVEIKNRNGQSTGKSVNLKEEVFGQKPNDHAIYLAVKQYLAAQRQGTHKAKERNEIAGSTKKIKKQKGTGTARAGSIKSPIFRGGGRIFGPKPRNYGIKLNKKLKAVARNSALSYKAQNNGLIVLDEFSMDSPKTKEFLEIMKNLDQVGNKTLIVVNQEAKNTYLSGRNVPKTKVVALDGLNTYNIVNSNTVIFTKDALDAINQ